MNNSHQENSCYLWAIGSNISQFQPNDLVQERYRVINAQIWQDTNPNQLPSIPEELPEVITPYSHLFSKQLHLPLVYGFCEFENDLILLLENIPVDNEGNLYPSLTEAWSKTSAVRQAYWLWQILNLWTDLEKEGVAASLLIPDNIRVQGWRVRLRELISGKSATLQDLGANWQSLANSANSELVLPLKVICEQLQAETADLEEIINSLNQLLLEQAAQQPLRIQVAGGTDIGKQANHNEDNYFPSSFDLETNGNLANQQLASHLTMVCDGIGGHEGGEVASQLAIQSLKLQIQALLAEIETDITLMSPDLVKQQLEAVIRVANNMISFRNNEQGRESRKRMGTTLVLALQLPQKFGNIEGGAGNSHELYIAHIGDSRAYWLTGDTCYRLTVDDDVASRETKLGRSLYRKALERLDSGALTQALGTKDGELVQPTIQRFIIEEDGLLLLCSDGLCDYDLLETHFPEFAHDVISGRISVAETVDLLINLANTYNGHDNISVVLSLYGVSPQHPVLVNLDELPIPTLPLENPVNSQLVIHIPQIEGEHLPVLVENENNSENDPENEVEAEIIEEASGLNWWKVTFISLGVIALLVVASVVGILIQWVINPNLFTPNNNNQNPNQEQNR